ncbi:MAG: hypothetical protein RBT45_06735 [Acholeplasmataceae bacterium]|jgi:hypothetical protein|nr:hypothetical protein [Acholeplasmataceae bacterium]
MIYKVDRSKNEFNELKKSSFSKNGVKERPHLQEWISKNPKCLGEDLLIISKEFDQWDKSKDRFDLLGMDKLGNLVVIENKTDNSGNTIDWQSIKYASYVSTLILDQIIDMYSTYRKISKDEAKGEIVDFIGGNYENLEEQINQEQRIIMVSKEYQDGIKSAVNWLIDQGIKISLFEVHPFEVSGELIIDFDRILPQDLNDYYVRLKKQKTETKEKRVRDKTKYAFDKLNYYPKSRFVLKVIQDYLHKNPNMDVKKLYETFPDETQGSFGVIREKSIIQSKNYVNRDHYFMNDPLIIQGKEYMVSTEWSIDNIDRFVSLSIKLGYQVDTK